MRNNVYDIVRKLSNPSICCISTTYARVRRLAHEATIVTIENFIFMTMSKHVT